MAQQGGGFGKIVLWVVLGVAGILLAGWLIGVLLGALLKILFATLIIGAIAGVALLMIRGVRRSVSGGENRRRLPR